MKKILLAIIVFLPSVLLAQHARGTFGSSNYLLMGETEIVLKDGNRVSCSENIDGTKIGDTDIDYKDVDHIRLIKTRVTGHDSQNGSIYKYLTIKNKPKLVKVIIETPMLSFYQERPKTKRGRI